MFMDFFQPSWNVHDEVKALKGLEQICDGELISVVVSARHISVRKKAVDRLFDVDFLVKIANDEKQHCVVREAANNKIAKLSSNYKLAKTAIDKITDSETLKTIVNDSKSEDIAYAALEKITDSKKLVDIIKNIESINCIKHAQIYENGRYCKDDIKRRICETSIGKIPTKVLIDIVKNTKNFSDDVRLIAVYQLIDPAQKVSLKIS